MEIIHPNRETKLVFAYNHGKYLSGCMTGCRELATECMHDLFSKGVYKMQVGMRRGNHLAQLTPDSTEDIIKRVDKACKALNIGLKSHDIVENIVNFEFTKTCSSPYFISLFLILVRSEYLSIIGKNVDYKINSISPIKCDEYPIRIYHLTTNDTLIHMRIDLSTFLRLFKKYHYEFESTQDENEFVDQALRKEKLW